MVTLATQKLLHFRIYPQVFKQSGEWIELCTFEESNYFLVTSGCSGVTLLSLLSLKFNELSLLSQCFR